jgi:hypothetical protein
LHATGEVVVVVVVMVVVVVDAEQLGPLPGTGNASQQLVHPPTIPLQDAASLTTLHLVPVVLTTPQVSAPGLPQVE